MIEFAKFTESQLKRQSQAAWNLLAKICRDTPAGVRLSATKQMTEQFDRSPTIGKSFKRKY